MRLIDLTAKKFARLTVLRRATNSRCGLVRWECKCICGNVAVVCGRFLRTGVTRSCGCLKLEVVSKHGVTKKKQRPPEYDCWASMIKRCENQNCKGWKWYGARGISVCPEWRNSFEAFIAYIGPRPTPKHSIDRYPNNDGNYEPGNVRWATQSEQNKNKRWRVAA